MWIFNVIWFIILVTNYRYILSFILYIYILLHYNHNLFTTMLYISYTSDTTHNLINSLNYPLLDLGWMIPGLSKPLTLECSTISFMGILFKLLSTILLKGTSSKLKKIIKKIIWNPIFIQSDWCITLTCTLFCR